MKNVVLIGMPGCGKSSLGVILAKQLGMQFCDTDLLIQKSEQKKLQEILDAKGVDEFLKIEEKEILRLDVAETVIATGGSVILSSAAVYHLRKNGILVYLKLPYAEIKKRVRNLTTRGIAMEKAESLEDIFYKRTPLYEKNADITVDISNLSMEESLNRICKEIQEKL